MAALMKSANINARVESIVANLIASRFPADVQLVAPRLHDRRMEIQIVGHHRRAENADRDVEHAGIGHDLR